MTNLAPADGMPRPASGASQTPEVPVGTKVAYGLGAIAFGVKDNGFSFFLLIFYSQIVGLDAGLVGLAITIALVWDAFCDPIIGYWSDNLHSRWGRRHPFMYAAAIPVAASYFLLWRPPEGWSDMQLFWYLLALAITIRTFVNVFETPSTALAPELSKNYDERSSLLSFRFFFGWTGGNVMSVLMFVVLFPMFSTAAIPNGQFNRDAYSAYGVIASIAILVAILVSAIGTHSRIPHLNAPPPKRDLTIGKIFGEIFETLSNKSFLSLFVAGIFAAIGGGLSASLSFYILTYFWDFTAQQIGLITSGVFGSAVIGALLAPIVTRTLGKKKGAIIIGLLAFIGSPAPILLRLAGLLPHESTPFTFWFVFFTTLVDVGLIICFQILSTSMMADLVEQAELKTGRRSEGMFFAASSFIRKLVGGLGVMMATLILKFVAFPTGAAPGDVPMETVRNLVLIYVPTIFALWIAMILVMSTYSLKREDHEDNLRKIAVARGGGGSDAP